MLYKVQQSYLDRAKNTNKLMILTQTQTAKKVAQLKKQGKTVGLCIGFYDVLNIRHVKLFKFAKTQVDVLVVGMEQSESARINISGGNRPIDTQEMRLEFLSELKSVDIIFVMAHVIDFKATPNASDWYKKLFAQIAPTHLITNTITDKFSEKKKELADELGIEFVGLPDISFLESESALSP